MKPVEWVFPPRCLLCGEVMTADELSDESAAFCTRCFAVWENEKKRMKAEEAGQPVAPLYEGNGGEDRFGSVPYLAPYEPDNSASAARALVLRMKMRVSPRPARFAAREFHGLLKREAGFLFGPPYRSETAIAFVPRRRENIARFGFDHMERCARFLSALTGFPAENLLVRKKGAAEQKALDAAGRFRNARLTLSVAQDAKTAGRTVLLLDDVMTTGASLAAAVSLLESAGVRQVIPMVLARTRAGGADGLSDRESSTDPGTFDAK